MNTFSTFSVLFFIRNNRINSEGKSPVYIRITVNGERAEISTKRFILSEKWDNNSNRAIGKSSEIKAFNNYLHTLRSKLIDHHTEMVKIGETITARSLKNRFLGISENQRTLIEVFEYHNQQMKELEGTEYAVTTIKRYNTTLTHIKAFLKHQYKLNDIPIQQIKYQFVTDLEHYFKVVKKCNHNSSIKYIKNFRKVINLAYKNEWLSKDPFAKYQARIKEVKREFLTQDELFNLENKKLTIKRLEIVRDVFVFCCYTGLSFIDVSKLTSNNIRKGIDRKIWLFTERTKTKNQSNIPLLPQALDLIEKYKNHPQKSTIDHVFPVSSNQKLNAYLKELADLCDIDKNLTFHIARHTFATTVTLANGIPIETISSMLGHKSIRTAQIYSKVVQTKVSNDMKKLKKKIGY